MDLYQGVSSNLELEQEGTWVALGALPQPIKFFVLNENVPIFGPS
jgi:hypothetical protein